MWFLQVNNGERKKPPPASSSLHLLLHLPRNKFLILHLFLKTLERSVLHFLIIKIPHQRVIGQDVLQIFCTIFHGVSQISFHYMEGESFYYYKYRGDENQLYIFADDSVSRWLTTPFLINFDTVAGAYKFGNVYFMRPTQDLSDEIEENPTGGKIKWDRAS